MGRTPPAAVLLRFLALGDFIFFSIEFCRFIRDLSLRNGLFVGESLAWLVKAKLGLRL